MRGRTNIVAARGLGSRARRVVLYDSFFAALGVIDLGAPFNAAEVSAFQRTACLSDLDTRYAAYARAVCTRVTTVGVCRRESKHRSEAGGLV